MEAVKDDVGGSNPALARTIAGDHPGNHIYCSLLPTHVEDQMCYTHITCAFGIAIHGSLCMFFMSQFL